MFKFDFAGKCFAPIFSCLPATLELTIGAVLIALIGGILLSFGVRCRIRAVNFIFSVVNSFLKGIPILVFLYMFNTSIDDIMTKLSEIFHFTYNIRNQPTFAFAVLALALSYSPYMCDMIVTALDTIPKGQWEACDAMGFTKWQTMKRIILPQCVVIAIPNFGNHFVNLLKASSLACMVTIMEMMGAARNFATMNQRFLETYTVCALIYWGVFLLFEQLFRIIEKKCGVYMQAGVVKAKRTKKILPFFRKSIDKGIIAEVK